MRKLSGDGPYNKKCKAWLESHFGAPLVVLTPSCTSALEMGLVLMDIKPGDEVIVPSYTFSSTASAVAILGGVPVFIDSDPTTLNMDPNQLEALITPKTKGLIPMHYAGIGCDMGPILKIAQKHNLFVLEDAAQCMGATRNGKKLGTFGQVSAFSFHDTKNISCGEGGCLVVNNPTLVQRAEIIRDKGTNRSAFFRGSVDKYTWVDIGSSYLMSDLQAEYLLGQLENLENITKDRLETWAFYHAALAPLEEQGVLTRMQVPAGAQHNAHIYYIVLESEALCEDLRVHLTSKNIPAVAHYVPLHRSPAGKKFGRTHGALPIASDIPHRLLRLPISYKMKPEEKQAVINEVFSFFKAHSV